MKMQHYILLVFISIIITLPLQARHKAAVTQGKIKASLIDLLRDRDNLKVERDRLRKENEQIKSVSSSSWLLVNHSGSEARLSVNDSILIKAGPRSVNEALVKTMDPLKTGSRMKLELGSSDSIKLKLKPGVTEFHKTKDGKKLAITIDFLTGTRVWMLLIRPE